MLWLQTNKSGSGTMNLGGSLTRQVNQRLYYCVEFIGSIRIGEILSTLHFEVLISMLIISYRLKQIQT